ncbi:MAG: aminoglycoside phosphotransferase family protein [Mycetocola sp.]
METLALATSIVRSLGISVARTSALRGGNQNHVVRVNGGGRDLVVRFAKVSDQVADPFDVEAWCLRAAATAGIPSSPMVARGWLDGLSYLVVDYVAGSTASASDPGAWRSIGRFASVLAELDVTDAPETLFSRFGRDLDAAWLAHLDYNRAALTEGDELVDLGVYRPDERSRLLSLLDSLQQRSLPQGLIHGDMSTRNLLGGERHTLIDWGAATVGPVVWGDLERIHRWKLLEDPESAVSDVAWANVLEGSGLTDTEATTVVRELTVLQALDVIRWALEVRPDRLSSLVPQSTALLSRALNSND